MPATSETKSCESCGTDFILKDMDRHIRWCNDCRKHEYAKNCRENAVGLYRRRNSSETKLKKRYVDMVLDKIIKSCELKIKHRPILDMRISGKTYAEIADKLGCSKQNIHEICKNNACNQ